MATPKPLFATVIHLLETGHVLAAVASGDLAPKLEDLTGSSHVRVGLPGKPGFVNVPISALKAERASVDPDVLDRPQHYRFVAGLNPLTLGDKPEFGGSVAAGTAGAKCIVVWQDGDKSIVTTDPLDSGGAPPSKVPPGASHKLVAYVGGPLFVTTA